MSAQVADKIRDARRKRGWSTDELGERSGLSGNIIENIEGGRRKGGERTRDVTVDELFAISEAFGVGPLRLLPSAPRPRPEELERERAIQQAMQELGAERSRLEMLERDIARAEVERRAVEDQVAKTTWLIEQLRDRD